MGYRTTVILNNDHHERWSTDPDLGKNISQAMNFANMRNPNDRYHADIGGYGRVVECVHNDQQTLALVESFDIRPLAHANWNPRILDEDVILRLLRDAADKLGYNLTKKRKV